MNSNFYKSLFRMREYFSNLMLFSLVLALSVTAGLGDDESVCYDLLGCFSTAYPHNNTNILPQSPDIIQTKFALFTRKTRNQREYLSYKDDNSIINSKFDRSLPLKVIVHGFANTLEKEWLHQMKNTILDVENVNVMIVGWGKGCEFPNYGAAASNIRTVAAELNLLLFNIENVFQLHTNQFKVHCIGHSLGAQVCGVAGAASDVTYDRITGLDPAGPFFENTDSSCSVDPGDARFVDVIHSNAGTLIESKFGMIHPTGTVDFYPNGGAFQPGCPSLLSIILSCLGNLEECKGDPTSDIGCSHNRAPEMFIESIKSPCKFSSSKCNSYEEYQNGDCSSCKAGGCSVMGYHVNRDATGSHYLTTAAEAPFCTKQYLFQMTVNENSPKTAGEITLKINGGSAISVIAQNTDIFPGSNIGGIFSLDEDITGDFNAEMQFKRKVRIFGKNPDSKDFNVDKIKIVDLKSSNTFSVCQKNTVWTDKEILSTVITNSDCRV